jgi:hypothetical protein
MLRASRRSEGKRQLGKLDSHERSTFKIELQEIHCDGGGWIHMLPDIQQCPVARSYEHGNDILSSITGGEFIGPLGDFSIVTKGNVPWN